MITPWILCPCGQRGYGSVAKAKEATAKARNRFRVFRCPESYTHHVTDSDRTQRLGKSKYAQAIRRQDLRRERKKAKAELFALFPAVRVGNGITRGWVLA